jgi:hypothetical protein
VVLLAQAAGALPGPARARRDVVAELYSGVLDAADAYRRAGLPEITAAEAAVDEFGDPRQVAGAFTPELTARHVRKLHSCSPLPARRLACYGLTPYKPATLHSPVHRYRDGSASPPSRLPLPPSS